MSTSTLILLIIASSAIIIHSRSMNNPDQLIPFLFSSVNDDNTSTSSPSTDSENRLLHMMEHIIKYVSTIKSSEAFIDNIVDQQKEVIDKFKVLTFLNKCFQLADTVIQSEIHRISSVSTKNKKSLTSSLIILEELHQAQDKIHGLLNIIKKRMAILKRWFPPTMPFLGV